VSPGLEAVARRAWAPETPADRALRATLVPAALVYGAASALRNRLYDRGWLGARRVPARVVSVGNLAVGGTGKTPAALWVAEGLASRGHRVGIVARGYRKRRRGVVVVGEGGGRPLVGAEDGGDEAVMLARRFAGPVVTGERRADAAALACARFALDAVVLDDGFQHRALARDADLVLLGDDAGGAWPLPAGPLREWRGNLERADALLTVDAPPPVAAGVPGFRARLRPAAVVRVEGDAWVEMPLETLAGRQVTAVAGMARPERLAATLRALGASVRRLLAFPDHHRYGAAEALAIAAAAGEDPVVTTEKDLVKLERLPGLRAPWALRMRLEVEQGEALLDLLAGRRSDAQVDLRPD
jgi:tetraacyldisaccharide 4'-kinase